MATKYPTGRDIVKTPSYIASTSFDPDFEVIATEILGYEPVGGTLNRIKVNADGEWVVNIDSSALPSGASTSANQTTQTTLLQGIAGFNIAGYDYVALTYTGDNLTGLVFKSGGAGGSTIATLTLVYTGSVLDSVTKT